MGAGFSEEELGSEHLRPAASSIGMAAASADWTIGQAVPPSGRWRFRQAEPGEVFVTEVSDKF